MTTALEGVRGQSHAPAVLYPRERPGTYCTGGWVDPRAGLDRCGKSRPHRDSIPGPSSPSPVTVTVTTNSVMKLYIYIYIYIYRFQNCFLCCPTPRLHCFLSSHWPSFRFLSFMAFLILSIQFFFCLSRALFCFGIHFNAILGNLYSAIL